MTAHANQSLATVRIAGREYPAASRPRCGTCTHPARRRIEERLVQGEVPSVIARDLPDAEALTPRQVMNHFRHHMPLRAAGITLYRDQVAVGRGNALTPGAEQVASALSFARRVIGTVDVRLAMGQVQPTIADALRAAVVLAPTETDSAPGQSDEDTYIAFVHYLQAVQAHTTDEQFSKIAADIKSNPILMDLWQRRATSAVSS